MSRIVSRAVKVALGLSAALGILAFTSTGMRDLLLDIYLLGMGGVLLLALVRTERREIDCAGAADTTAPGRTRDQELRPSDGDDQRRSVAKRAPEVRNQIE